MKIFSYLRGLYRHHELDGDPIVIGGCERSGTTLLRAVVSAHPAVLTIPYETWGLASGTRAGFERSDPVRMWRIWKGLGVARWRRDQERWAEKTPANIFYIEEILDQFGGDVQLIECVRDGRDVVTSIHPEDETPWVPVDRWIEAVEAGRSFRGHPNVHTVRYEDLVEDTEGTVESLYDFLDLPVEIGGGDVVSDWYERATVRSSVNLSGRKVGRIHLKSLRKWERPGFPYSDRIDELLSRQRARCLLSEHGYR